MQQETGFAAVYVTHDHGEAMQLAGRIAVISSGRIVQIDEPRVLYRQPGSLFTAWFVGTLNEVPGTVLSVQDGTVIVRTEAGQLHGTAVNALSAGQRVAVVWRPERCQILAAAAAAAPTHRRAGLVQRSFVGACVESTVHIGGHLLRQWGEDEELETAADAQMWLSVRPQDVQVFPDDGT